jgi:hypothetical protein
MFKSCWRSNNYGKEEKVMSESILTFTEWCDSHSFNPDNDDNFDMYLTWVGRQKMRMRTVIPPLYWSEEDTVTWENMDAETKREFVLSSALGEARIKPSEWSNNKKGETK